MKMTPLQKHLVRRSFGVIAGRSEVIGQLFYARLFALDPAARELFRHDMNEQVNRLMRMIALCVSFLDNEPMFITTVEELGARHAGYGVRDEHYAIVGEALIWALSQGLGTEFTPDVQSAWAALYDRVAEIAIRGAQAATSSISKT